MKKFKNQNGQALVMLLFFMVISISVITAVVIVTANNLLSGSSIEVGTVAYYSAETGIENSLIRLLRDPSYTGETMDVDGVTVIIQVSGNVITSTAEYGKSIRKIEVQTMYNNNILTIDSWKEIN